MAEQGFTIPRQYTIEGFTLGEDLAPVETLKTLKKGEGPQYEVLVATYPRSGTARLVEIAWLLMNDIDVEKARVIDQGGRHVYLDMCAPDFKSCFEGKLKLPTDAHALAKTHLPYHMMEKHTQRDTKIIVGLRNPKDNLVSFYHFYRMNKLLGNFTGTFHDFFKLVKTKQLAYGDVFDHSTGWWNIRDRPNTMYVFYEDVSEDPVREVRRIAEFLGKNVSDDDVIKIADWTTFGNMSEAKSTNYTGHKGPFNFKVSPYMRKGTVGDWKNYFNEEESKYIDEQDKKFCAPLGLSFRYEF
eukprot:GHVO01067238.1.p1 GENE.GHVO01067238.1~~GHVO01067238.1.p1  ORF type:complete len:298 (-),score=33.37 GHVO01067238.1:101-994(-)